MAKDFENDDNRNGTANSNFVDDKENPYISDPNVITRLLVSRITASKNNLGVNSPELLRN